MKDIYGHDIEIDREISLFFQLCPIQSPPEIPQKMPHSPIRGASRPEKFQWISICVKYRCECPKTNPWGTDYFSKSIVVVGKKYSPFFLKYCSILWHQLTDSI
jgi:hypothetical protein